MDMAEQGELQFLGLSRIYLESWKIIVSWRKIFSQITLALILPLSSIYLAHYHISNLLFANIIHAQDPAGTPTHNKSDHPFSSELAYFWLFKAAFLTLFLIFSLLSTAAVVYTVASIYTGRDVDFKKVMRVVPKVWKRLMLTFLSIFVAVLGYNVLAFLLLGVALVIWALAVAKLGILYAILGTWSVAYLAGLLYMQIVWQLASVVSVLEEACGVKAMSKSRALIKGKRWVAVLIQMKLSLSYGAILTLFQKLVVGGGSRVGTADRVWLGILSFFLLLVLFLFELVVKTIIYLVCKSYHHENIDKSALSHHLDGYLLEYVPLKSKDVQLEHFDV